MLVDKKIDQTHSTHRPEMAGVFLLPAGKEETDLVTVIIEEMGRDNFSFLILIVGLLQLIVMLRKRQE